MKWYRSLEVKQKVRIRETFELACGLPLNYALRLFSFSECMDILHNKLVLEGIVK